MKSLFFSLIILLCFNSDVVTERIIDSPTVVFKRNSLKYDLKYEKDINAIDLALILNPSITLIIKGSMDSETENINSLDLKRAELIKSKLVNKGVDSLRLIIDVEKYDDKLNKSLKESYFKYDPELYYNIKRSVRFLIKDFDYKSSN